MASQTKERGMIFNAEMVRALLDGNKTQTRRPVGENLASVFDFLGGDVNEQEEDRPDISICNVSNIDRLNEETGNIYKYTGMLACCAECPEEGYEEIKCPFGQVGDRIWVRETHHVNHHGGVIYKADWQGMNPFNEDECGDDCSMVGEKWRPSIHMPRWASRITLEITDVRVERLQDMTDDDARHEGIEDEEALSYPCSDGYYAGYSRLWQSIYGNWDDNPWVWAISFKVVNQEAMNHTQEGIS